MSATHFSSVRKRKVNRGKLSGVASVKHHHATSYCTARGQRNTLKQLPIGHPHRDSGSRTAASTHSIPTKALRTIGSEAGQDKRFDTLHRKINVCEDFAPTELIGYIPEFDGRHHHPAL